MMESTVVRRVLAGFGLLAIAACSSTAGAPQQPADSAKEGAGEPALPEHQSLTITGIAWKSADDDPARLMENRGANILLCRVAEHFDSDDAGQYTRFTYAADREFELRSPDGQRFAATCRLGFEVGPGLHAVWIAVPVEIAAKIPAKVPLQLVPRNESPRKWIVRAVVPPRPGPGESPAPLAREPLDLGKDHAALTITRAVWVDDPEAPDHVELHVAEWFDDQDGDQYKRFSAECDQEFTLRAAGAPDVAARCAVGSITGPGRHSCALYVDIEGLRPGVAYRLIPRNQDVQRKWIVREDVTITR